MPISSTSSSRGATLTARIHPSGFPQSHDTYNAMGTGSDGRIYYVLCSALPDVGARMYSYDPASGKIELLGDLTDACGETGSDAIAQGKSHVNFVDAGAKLFFATHIWFYQIIDDMEKAGMPPSGMKPYRGGHLLSWDIKQSRFEDYGITPSGE